MALGIRQFLTYEELLNRSDDAPPHPRFGEFYRPPDIREAYFDALEVLRGHLSRCLGPCEPRIRRGIGCWRVPIKGKNGPKRPIDGR